MVERITGFISYQKNLLKLAASGNDFIAFGNSGGGKSGQRRAFCFLTGRGLLGDYSKCNRKYTAPYGVRVKWWGKSPPVLVVTSGAR